MFAKWLSIGLGAGIALGAFAFPAAGQDNSQCTRSLALAPNRNLISLSPRSERSPRVTSA